MYIIQLCLPHETSPRSRDYFGKLRIHMFCTLDTCGLATHVLQISLPRASFVSLLVDYCFVVGSIKPKRTYALGFYIQGTLPRNIFVNLLHLWLVLWKSIHWLGSIDRSKCFQSSANP
mmetsp:Transcript_18658/g.40393  ORF Transcript_18658/g.40393 Transcript_18658/m.40393 type:complete len:118 (+) Transcript_18658:375-728(+)